jgi:DNA ligase-1
MTDKKRSAFLNTGHYDATPKMDGLRCLFILIPGSEKVISRHGKPLKNLEPFMDKLKAWFSDYPCVVDGEILASDNSWDSTVTATKKAGAKVDAQFYPFDLIPAEEYLSGTYTMPKFKRWAIMDDRIDYNDRMFQFVHRIPVRTVEEVNKELEECIDEGWEGVVLHDRTAVYRADPEKADNRTMAMVKVKTWLSSEFRVINFVAGRGKHMGRLGAFVVDGVYEGHQVECEVGGGFDDALREEIWNNQDAWKGACVEIKFFSLSKGSGNTKSLRFPTYLRRRIDLE